MIIQRLISAAITAVFRTCTVRMAALLATATTLAVVVNPAVSAPIPAGLQGTIWVGNRVWNDARPEIIAYDAASGLKVHEVQLPAAVSDLAAGKGKVFAGDETNNRVWTIDASTGEISFVPTSAKPHHLSSSRGGNLIAYGAFGTNRVGVIDAGTGDLVGEWPAATDSAARVHAAAFSPDGSIVYTANDVTAKEQVGAVDIRTGDLLWTAEVPKAHELIVSSNGRFAYVSCRRDNMVRVLNFEDRSFADLVSVPLPDTLQLSANGKQLTAALRNGPNLAVIDTESGSFAPITIPGTLAGHQWTTPNGHYTFVAYEGGLSPGTAMIEHATNTIARVLEYPGGGQPHGLAYLGPERPN